MALLESICATSVSVIGRLEPQEVFSWLPVAHCVGGAVLVMHGGLSRQDGVTLEDIRRIERGGLNPERDGLMCDLLWSDPQVSQSVSRILGMLRPGLSLQFDKFSIVPTKNFSHPKHP